MNAENIEQKAFIEEVIKDQSGILGPTIAIKRARTVKGIKISDQGEVLELSKDSDKIAEAVVLAFLEILGPITIESSIMAISGKYSQLDEKIKKVFTTFKAIY